MTFAGRSGGLDAPRLGRWRRVGELSDGQLDRLFARALGVLRRRRHRVHAEPLGWNQANELVTRPVTPALPERARREPALAQELEELPEFPALGRAAHDGAFEEGRL